jgi:hypothetical protein
MDHRQLRRFIEFSRDSFVVNSVWIANSIGMSRDRKICESQAGGASMRFPNTAASTKLPVHKDRVIPEWLVIAIHTCGNSRFLFRAIDTSVYFSHDPEQAQHPRFLIKQLNTLIVKRLLQKRQQLQRLWPRCRSGHVLSDHGAQVCLPRENRSKHIAEYSAFGFKLPLCLVASFIALAARSRRENSQCLSNRRLSNAQ